MTITHDESRVRNHSSKSLITLETMTAAAKAVQAQDQDDRLRVTIVSCESAFESDEFQSVLAIVG